MSGVRFHHKGPIIPYKLLRAQERGETVFLCGAGVSMGAGLPDFYNLVRQIYVRLDEDYSVHPAEADGMKSRAHCAPDRTLFALQERLRLGPERVLKAITEELETTSRGTAAHFDLLRLSRDSTNARIVTTNFDTLFERAWADRTGAEIQSWSASGMPGPGSADFRGVFHLHGRLADTSLPHTLERSQLVLTSAEFGDAYLRSGWASRYLYDLLLHANVVIVGYSLNDPPTRYLFDALSADRHRFQFKSLYAIAPATPSTFDKAGALWRARGAIPLLYDSRRNHTGLYETLSGWAAYADNPTAWATNETARIFNSAPDSVPDEDWRRLDWVFTRADADRLIDSVNPNSEWLGPLAERPARVEADVSLGRWLERRMNDHDMMTAVLRHPRAVDQRAKHILNYSLIDHRTALTVAERQFWRLLIAQIEESARSEDRLHYLLRMVSAGDVDQAMRSALSRSMAPRPILAPRPPSSDYAPPAGSLRELAEVTFNVTDDSAGPDDIRNAWPSAHDGALLRELDYGLQRALNFADELHATRISVMDIPSMADHVQNAYRHGFNLLVRTMVKIWDRLAIHDASAAKFASHRWAATPSEIQQRMWLHTLAEPTVYSGQDVQTAIQGFTDDVFWGVQYQREVMRLLVERWNDMSRSARRAIAKRTIAGDPR